MTQFSQGSSRQSVKRGGGINIYTALMAIAILALLSAIIFAWYRSTELFNTATPFEIVPVASIDPDQTPAFISTIC